MNREFQAKLKAIEKERDDELRELRRSHDREKEELRENLRAELCEVSRSCFDDSAVLSEHSHRNWRKRLVQSMNLIVVNWSMKYLRLSSVDPAWRPGMLT